MIQHQAIPVEVDLLKFLSVSVFHNTHISSDRALVWMAAEVDRTLIKFIEHVRCVPVLTRDRFANI
jgi:hypothetical protein